MIIKRIINLYKYDGTDELCRTLAIFIDKLAIQNFALKKFGSTEQTPEVFDKLLEYGIPFSMVHIIIPIETLSERVQLYLKLN